MREIVYFHCFWCKLTCFSSCKTLLFLWNYLYRMVEEDACSSQGIASTTRPQRDNRWLLKKVWWRTTFLAALPPITTYLMPNHYLDRPAELEVLFEEEKISQYGGEIRNTLQKWKSSWTAKIWALRMQTLEWLQMRIWSTANVLLDLTRRLMMFCLSWYDLQKM